MICVSFCFAWYGMDMDRAQYLRLWWRFDMNKQPSIATDQNRPLNARTSYLPAWWALRKFVSASWLLCHNVTGAVASPLLHILNVQSFQHAAAEVMQLSLSTLWLDGTLQNPKCEWHKMMKIGKMLRDILKFEGVARRSRLLHSRALKAMEVERDANTIDEFYSRLDNTAG